MSTVQKFKQCVATAIAVLLVFVFVLTPVNHRLETQHTEAAGAVLVVGGNGTIQETISAGANGIVAGIQAALELKEFTLDGIAWALAKAAVRSMTTSIVNWINSGFQGSPAFLSDMKGFLLSVADQIAGNFIYKAGLGALCSPFELDIRFALEVQYMQDRDEDSNIVGSNPLQCTLSGVVNNFQNFLDGGNISNNGGWDGWFDLTVKPGNNPYGAFAIARHQMSVSIRNAQGQEIGIAAMGEGFLSMKRCTANANGEGQTCRVMTPGQVIEEQLNANLDSGRESLITADEIDEIITALFAQLTQQIFQGINGLFGLSTASYGGSTYTGSLANDPNFIGLDVDSPVSGSNPIQQGITDTSTYQGVHQQIVNEINSAQSLAASACAAAPALPTSLTSQLTTSQIEIGNSAATLSVLNNLTAQYVATSTPANVLATYTALQATGAVPTQTDVVAAQALLGTVQTTIATYQSQVTAACP